MSSPNAVRGSKNPAPIFAALGDATRLKLVSRLVDGEPRSIAQLADGLALTRQRNNVELLVVAEDAHGQQREVRSPGFSKLLDATPPAHVP